MRQISGAAVLVDIIGE